MYNIYKTLCIFYKELEYEAKILLGLELTKILKVRTRKSDIAIFGQKKRYRWGAGGCTLIKNGTCRV